MRRILLAILLSLIRSVSWAESTLQFDVYFPSSVNVTPITGRLLLMVSRSSEPEVRFQIGSVNSPPLFGIDVDRLQPGRTISIDERTSGYPVRSLAELPPGDYYVQTLLNVYTEFHRSDGHTIWAHMDQWEGQRFNASPGNLYSKMMKIHLGAGGSHGIRIALTEVIPPIQVPPDSEWVKHIKIPSKLLTEFWGRPMYLGAVVLLPRSYSSHPDRQYPVIYQQNHFSLDGPFDFRTDDPPETIDHRDWRRSIGVETGYEFYNTWRSEGFPQMIAVTFLHPTPFYDDSYAVNSANNGPFGDAIMTELIPYIETNFRIIRESYARVLTGGSTGGWESLALQVYHPHFFGGAWVLYPDPVDFRRYLLINIYEDKNAFVYDPPQTLPFHRGDWSSVEQPVARSAEGQVVATVRQQSQLEAVLASKGRSGAMLDNWEAIYGPVGVDGYPQPLWDKETGKIDHSVANYMRQHRYDLQAYIRDNWHTIGRELKGKVHIYCGDMDNFYLNSSVYLLQQLFQDSKGPHYSASFEYGRPMKGHGWQPMTNGELVKAMARYIAGNSPRESSLEWMSGARAMSADQRVDWPAERRTPEPRHRSASILPHH
jgi:hypothetical protein